MEKRDQHQVVYLESEDAAAAVSVLSASFFDYPTMRFVLGPEGDYPARLKMLITMFVTARFWDQEIMLGIRGPDGLVAAAMVLLPGAQQHPTEFVALYEQTWTMLGNEARSRYEAFSRAADTFVVEGAHVHLNMISVHPSARGQGLGRALLEAVHALSASHVSSTGVTLTTELAANVSLYEHFGYELLGIAQIGPALKSWGFYRRDR